MYEYVLSTLLISFSIFTGFLLVGYVRPKDMNEEEAKKFDEYTDQCLYEYSFLEELDNTPDSNLTIEQLNDLKNDILKMDLLYINQPIIMYYNNVNNSFSYYSNTDIQYKYLDIASRNYVIQKNCKQIYNKIKESEIIMNKPQSDASKMLNELFIKQQNKNNKKIIDKKMNKFIRVGSIYEYDYEKIKAPLEPSKNINILDYLKFTKKD
jgi:hypothetical protein